MVLLGDCNPRVSIWIETKQPDGTYVLKNKVTKKCLDSKASGKVYLYRCNGGDNQKWIETKDGFGWKLVDKATKRTLSGWDNGTVTTEKYDGGLKGQRWS
ncbi:hypothetical protein CD790_18900 [Streptomyces sp. SAJ15]|nr:hypothetical protein CD790_18900 [Streptomyces sp. SAJ15]